MGMYGNGVKISFFQKEHPILGWNDLNARTIRGGSSGNKAQECTSYSRTCAPPGEKKFQYWFQDN